MNQEKETAWRLSCMSNKPEIHHAGIADDVKFGKNVRVVMPSNLYGCNLGDNCFVGPFVEIQRGAVIGKNTKIQSHSFICDKVTIGDDCFIGHGVVFINDTFSELERPAYVERDLWKPTYIGKNVLIGSNATILPVRICDYAIIGAGTIVTKDIVKPGIYIGHPARFLRPLRGETHR